MISKLSLRRLGTVAAWLLIAVATAGAGTLVQDSVITATNNEYVYWEAEWFDRMVSPVGEPFWGIDEIPRYGTSGKQYITSPSAANIGGNNDRFVIYKLRFTEALAVGDYAFYAFHSAPSVGSSASGVFVPPGFDADPYQLPVRSGPGNPDNGWVGAPVERWNQLGLDGTAPAANYFATNAPTYRVTADDVSGSRVLELRLEAREGNTRFDRFALHKTSGLAASELEKLTFSDVTIRDRVAPARPMRMSSIGPRPRTGAFGIREVRDTPESALRSSWDAASLILSDSNGNPGTIRRDGASAVINFHDPDAPGGSGFFTGDARFLTNTPGDDDNIALIANGMIRVPVSGDYTFGFNVSDSAHLFVYGATFRSGFGGAIDGNLLILPSGGGDALGVTRLEAGDYLLEFVFAEYNGGAFAELYAARGAFSEFNAAEFRLIGDTPNGGLALVPEPTAGGLLFLGMLVTTSFSRYSGRRRGDSCC
jgi:hypothetical protein